MTLRPPRRDLLILTGGLTVSTAGDAAAMVALLLRLRPAGSGWVAGLLAAELVPTVLLAPVAGAVVDRVASRRVMLTAPVGQALVTVALALVGGPAPTVTLFALLGAVTAVVRPAVATLLPSVTGEADAARGYARQATGVSIGWIAGPAAAGLLIGAFGVPTTLLVDAATFVLLAAACQALRMTKDTTETPSDGTAWRASDGIVLLGRDRVLRVALLISAVAVGCAVIDNVATPFRFVDQLHTDAVGFSLYVTIWAAGALVGTLVFPSFGAGRTEMGLAVGNALTGAGIAGIGAAPTLVVAYAAAAVGGFGNGLGSVGQNALVHERAPAALRGRAFAASAAVFQAAIGVGTAAAAPLVSGLGADGALLLAGSLATAVALLAVVLAGRRGRTIPAGERCLRGPGG